VVAAGVHQGSNTGNAAVGDAYAEGDQFGYSMSLSGDGNTLWSAPSAKTAMRPASTATRRTTQRTRPALPTCSREQTARGRSRPYVKSTMTRANVLFGYAIGISGNGDTLAVAEYDADRGKGALYV